MEWINSVEIKNVLPECGFCPSDGSCHSRAADPAVCPGSNLVTGQLCPGICGSLGGCRSCVTHGSGECVWCSGLRKCVEKDGRKRRQVCMCVYDNRKQASFDLPMKQGIS